MTAWALVVNVKYLDPQTKRQGETATAFATRVKAMIAKEANLNSVPWDGYLKYYKPRQVLSKPLPPLAFVLNLEDPDGCPLPSLSPTFRSVTGFVAEPPGVSFSK